MWEVWLLEPSVWDDEGGLRLKGRGQLALETRDVITRGVNVHHPIVGIKLIKIES